MRNLYFILIILFSSFSCATQKQQEYKFINKAYHFINTERYALAVKSFKKAYTKRNVFFAVDYYNAMQAAILTNDVKFVKANALKLCELGMCSEFFINHSVLTIKGALGDELLQSCKSKSSFNNYLRDSLFKMMEEDQLIHRNPETYHLRRKVTVQILKSLKALFIDLGFRQKVGLGLIVLKV